jgi:hypothetical protein
VRSLLPNPGTKGQPCVATIRVGSVEHRMRPIRGVSMQFRRKVGVKRAVIVGVKIYQDLGKRSRGRAMGPDSRATRTLIGTR